MLPFRMPRTMNFAGRIATAATVMLAVSFGYLRWRIANPSARDLPLAAAITSADLEAGRTLRGRAVDRADRDLLDLHSEAQKYATYCCVVRDDNG